MKVIFLDVDGVLNNSKSKSRCDGFIGVDDDKVRRLKRIVDASGAEIVLSSTWRLGYNNLDIELKHCAQYLRNKLRKQGLNIYSATPDCGRMGYMRGQEIAQWLKDHQDLGITEWVVLDDEWFNDFNEYDIIPHWVETAWYGTNSGLQEQHIMQAVAILNGELNI